MSVKNFGPTTWIDIGRHRLRVQDEAGGAHITLWLDDELIAFKRNVDLPNEPVDERLRMAANALSAPVDNNDRRLPSHIEWVNGNEAESLLQELSLKLSA